MLKERSGARKVREERVGDREGNSDSEIIFHLIKILKYITYYYYYLPTTYYQSKINLS